MTTIPTNSTAKDILALVAAGTTTAAEATAFLQARVAACIARGAKPKFPTIAALKTLTGADVALPKGLTTSLQRKIAHHDARAVVATERLNAARVAKAAKSPAKPRRVAATKVASGPDAITSAARVLAAMDEATMAAFVSAVIVAKAR